MSAGMSSSGESGSTSGELRLVFVGKTGAGKSSTASTITGRKDIFKACGRGKSMTQYCQCETSDVLGQKLVLVDTPGMFDTQRNHKDIEREIGEFVRMTAPGPHAVLFVTSAANRFTKEEIGVIQKLQDMFGKEIEAYLIIIVTRTEEWEEEGIDVISFLNDLPPEAKSVLGSCIDSRRAIAFKNKFTKEGAPKDKKQVEELLELIKNTVWRNGNKCYTEAHWKKAEEEMKKREQEILEKEMKEEQEKLQKLENAAKEKIAMEFETKMKAMEEKQEKEREERERKEREAREMREQELILKMEQMRLDAEQRMETMRAEDRARAQEELRRSEQRMEEQRQREKEMAERSAQQAAENARQQVEMFKTIMEQQRQDAERRHQDQMDLEKRRLEAEARDRARKEEEERAKKKCSIQ